MKKSLIALAALAAAGVASAQSSVTLFGVVDVNYSHGSATGAGHVNVLRNDGYNSSRLGFRGTEDLGGGMSASFWLEAGINPDNGSGQNTTLNNTGNGDRIQFNTTGAGGTTYFPNSSLNGRQGLTFNRRSTVSLSGGWGELRVGRDYVPTFWNLTTFDPFGTLGVGGQQNVAQGNLNPRGTSSGVAPEVRSSNSIGYFLPANLGGIYGQAMYAFSEVPTSCATGGAAVGANTCFGANGDGRFVGARLGFASGPFDVAAAWARTRYSSAGYTNAFGGTGIIGTLNNTALNGDYTAWNIAGSWNFGVARLLAMYGHQDTDATTTYTGTPPAGTAAGDRSLRHWMIGAMVPVGAGEIKASYARGTRHDEAPATGGGAQAGMNGAKQTQYALGYVHNFSKRTAVYATYSHQKVTNPTGATGAVAGFNSFFAAVPGAAGSTTTANGVDLGIRHSF